MDGVQKANSGHPGTAMALAPIAYLYYREYPTTTRKSRIGLGATALSCRPATSASSNTRRCT